jgi:hypothetical protein
MRGELFEEENEILELEELYDPDERTELEQIKEHYQILLDYVVELEKRNELLKEKIFKLGLRLNYYEKQDKGLI